MFKYLADVGIPVFWHLGSEMWLAGQGFGSSYQSACQSLRIAGTASSQVVPDALKLGRCRLGPGNAHVGSPNRRRTSSTGTN